jgi:hypothetical protein
MCDESRGKSRKSPVGGLSDVPEVKLSVRAEQTRGHDVAFDPDHGGE